MKTKPVRFRSYGCKLLLKCYSASDLAVIIGTVAGIFALLTTLIILLAVTCSRARKEVEPVENEAGRQNVPPIPPGPPPLPERGEYYYPRP
jgi:hypothetical protein